MALRGLVLPVPDGLHNTNMDNIFADSLPLLTMLACVPVLRLFARQQKLADLGLYGLGFLLACIYHVCHMDEAGLIASRVMGFSGPFWRSADVYMAQWLLARMWGHALKASHPVTSGTANAAFPALILQSYLSRGQVTLAICSRMLLVTMALTAGAKIVCERLPYKQWWPQRRGLTVTGYLVLAFAAFPMPAVFPSCYWVFHSVWHVLLAAGCYELYAMLCGEEMSFWQESRLCVSDLGERLAQRVSAIVEVSRPLYGAQHGKPCIEESCRAAEAFQEQLHAERWQSCDLDMEQHFSEMSLFNQA